MRLKPILLAFLLSLAAVGDAAVGQRVYHAPRAHVAPVVDGVGWDACWAAAQWAPIAQLWAGEPVTDEDFSGRYKVVWTPRKLYILAEITDDVLRDTNPDGLEAWPDDDCMEVFLDEDAAGGEHTYTHDAFAYHVALDYRVVDLGTDRRPHYYNGHITTRRNEADGVSTWEMAVDVYDDTYRDDADDNAPVELITGKRMGFAIAYCDNDFREKRESFLGSVPIAGEDKNRAWRDADVFGILLLESPLRVASVFSDHMVLQRDMPVTVWGWAAPGQRVVVRFGEHAIESTTGDNGAWHAELPPMPADATGQTLSVTTDARTIAFSNVLVGDVWFCSGQSNMMWRVSASANAEAEVAAADHPLIRFFKAQNVVSGVPQPDIGGHWEVCRPQTVAGFSATAYFFGRSLQAELAVPIGLVRSAWGGTPAESWTPEPALRKLGYVEQIAGWESSLEQWFTDEGRQLRAEGLAAWREEVRKAEAEGRRLPRMPGHLRNPYTESWRPAALYNAMVHPFTRMAMRGVIWYQGESNAGRAAEYGKLFRGMICAWRERWDRPELPFLFVQLPNWRERQIEPVEEEDSWPVLREAQLSALSLPKTGMAVTIDIGEAGNIHPANKQDVGRRLARAALAVAYGRNVVTT